MTDELLTSKTIDERWYDGAKVTKAELASEVTRLTSALAETEQKLDEWYRLEARLHAAIHRHGGGDAIRAAIAELGVDPKAHNPRLADETSATRYTRETIWVLSRWIVQRGQDLRDHACAGCVPEGGDLVKPGYVCAYHLAEAYETERRSEETS